MGIIGVELGIVKNVEIKPNKDGKNSVRLLQCSLSDDDDIQTIEFVNSPGDDSSPNMGDAVTILTINESYKIAIANDDKITPTMEPGEKKIYSYASGSIQAFINLLKTGIIEINGNVDFAVRFNALSLIVQQAVTAINANLTAISADLQSLGGSYVPTPIVVDLTPAKIEEININVESLEENDTSSENELSIHGPG